MSIYIKGIGLPNDYNIECYIIEPDGTVLNSYNRCVGVAVEIKEPHGDLIDKDAIIQHAQKFEDEGNTFCLCSAEELEFYLDDEAPTIVERSER